MATTLRFPTACAPGKARVTEVGADCGQVDADWMNFGVTIPDAGGVVALAVFE